MAESDLSRLKGKYERMHALRIRHDRARNDPAYAEPDPTVELTKLADEFPGSLREIDRLTLASIEQRIASLEGVVTRGAPVEAWMRVQIAFHDTARSMLAVKRWLAGRAITEELRVEFVGRFGDALDLDAIASPPRGRVMDLVHAHVGRVLGMTAEEARAIMFSLRSSGR